MACCRCCNPIIENFEFELGNDIFISNNLDIKIPIQPTTDIDFLKDKIICEYKLIISELEKGHKPDLEFILEEISVVDLENEIDNREFIVQYYLNNKIWLKNIQ